MISESTIKNSKWLTLSLAILPFLLSKDINFNTFK